MNSSKKIVFFVASFSSIETTAPLGILAISTPLLEEGYEICIIDASITPDYKKRIMEEVKDALCLGISLVTGPMIRETVEVAKAKATGAEALLLVSRLNDAMLLTRELVKQRWTPMAVLSMGPGWYEDQYLKTLGRLADGPMSFVPWYDPNKPLSKQLEAALAKAHPDVNLNTNHIYTFEALLIAADAYRRAGSTDPKALADAIRATDIADNVSIGPGIRFDAKGQNATLKNAAIQNRGGKLVTIAPKAAANAAPEWPLSAYDKRG